MFSASGRENTAIVNAKTERQHQPPSSREAPGGSEFGLVEGEKQYSDY
jgi:hypothetical protein